MVLRNSGGNSAAASSQLLFPPTLPGPPEEELGPATTGSPAHISANTQLAEALRIVHVGRVKEYKVIPHQACELA